MHALLLLAATLAADPGAKDRVWIEGETPTRSTFAFRIAGWGRDAFLSGGKWLSVDLPADDVSRRIPPEGIGEYDFRAPSAGKYDLWVRVGYEFERSPFRWRIDGGAWTTIPPDAATTDRLALDDDTPLAWLRLSAIDLKPGPHTLELHLPPPIRQTGTRVETAPLRFAFDCACLTRAPFTPNGPFQPDAPWKTAADRVAERTTFEFPPSPPTPRRTLDLGGTWQVARLDEAATSPPTDLAELLWKGVRVPGDLGAERPDFALAHHVLFRTRVKVPAEFAGRSFRLRFPSVSLTASVYVNGRRIGASVAPFTPFEIDATAAMRPGEANEILVAVKDSHAAIPDGRHHFAIPTHRLHASDAARFADAPILGVSPRRGLLEAPSLIVTGVANIAHVVAKPSLTKKEIAFDIALHNPAKKPIDVRATIHELQPDGTLGAVVKTLTQKATSSNRIAFAEPWAEAKPWWPDAPNRYAVRVSLLLDGEPVDEVTTPFGVCEWRWSGTAFTLNGVPWALRCDSPDAPRKLGSTMTHLDGEGRSEALDLCDRVGMPVRRVAPMLLSSRYALGPDGKPNTKLLASWRSHLAAWVKAERHHPCIAVWSIGLNGDGGPPEWLDRELRSAAEMIAALDPTRPVVIDAPPRTTLPAKLASPQVVDIAFPASPSVSAITGGAVFATTPDALRRLAIESRWHGVPAIRFANEVPDAATLWAPVAVLVRDETPFVAGSKTTRTLKVFNDTREPATLTVHWLLQTRNTSAVKQVRGKSVVTVPPGGLVEMRAELDVPALASDADFVVSCDRDGRAVFREVHRTRIVEPAP